MQAEHTPTPYELAADDVIAVMLNEEAAFDMASFELGLLPAHMPTPQHKAAYEVISELRINKLPVHDTVVMDKSGGAVKLDWISQCFALYDATRTGLVFRENVKLVKEHGIRNGVQRVLNTAASQLAEGKKNVATIINQLMDILPSVQIDTSTRGETAAEIGKELLEMFESDPAPLLSTGLPWLDEISGGFDRKHLWWIAGAYKQRKSTLMLALALNAVMQGANVSILSREMPRKRVAAQMVAMLAVAHLVREGHYDAKDRNLIPINSISANMLMKAGKNFRKWHPAKVAAVQFGIDEWMKFEKRLRLYDSTEQGGALSDWSSIQRTIKRDKALYGLDVVLIDYMQLFSAQGQNTYEQTAFISKAIQKLTIREDITTVILAQKNEDDIKNGKKSYSPGIKGGGDAAASADFLLVTNYKQDEDADDEKLKVKMQLSRHGVGGADVEHIFDIHPASGLILDSDWISKIKTGAAA